MGWTQQTSKVVGSRPKVRVEIDVSHRGSTQMYDPSAPNPGCTGPQQVTATHSYTLSWFVRSKQQRQVKSTWLQKYGYKNLWKTSETNILSSPPIMFIWKHEQKLYSRPLCSSTSLSRNANGRNIRAVGSSVTSIFYLITTLYYVTYGCGLILQTLWKCRDYAC